MRHFVIYCTQTSLEQQKCSLHYLTQMLLTNFYYVFQNENDCRGYWSVLQSWTSWHDAVVILQLTALPDWRFSELIRARLHCDIPVLHVVQPLRTLVHSACTSDARIKELLRHIRSSISLMSVWLDGGIIPKVHLPQQKVFVTIHELSHLPNAIIPPVYHMGYDSLKYLCTCACAISLGYFKPPPQITIYGQQGHSLIPIILACFLNYILFTY